MASKRQRTLLEAGQKAPNFTLPDAEGTARTLTDILQRGPVLLAFYKSSCPVCQFTLPFVERLHRPSEAAGIQVFAISQDDAPETREFLSELGCTFPALVDDPETWPASNAFGISHVPSLFVVEQDLRISHAWTGWVKADMEAVAERLSAPLFRKDEAVPAWKAG